MQIHTVTPFERVEQQNQSLVPREGVLSTHSDMGRSDEAPVTPHIACCECGRELEAKYQAGLRAHMKGYWLITCVQENCLMQGFTLADCSYPPQDLDVYLESGRKRLALKRAKQAELDSLTHQDQVEWLCALTHIDARFVEETAHRVIVTIPTGRGDPQKLVDKLYAAMDSLRIPRYDLSHHASPEARSIELWFGVRS